MILSNPLNVIISDSLAIGRINNDDAALAQDVSSAVAHSKIMIPNFISRNQVWIIQGLSGVQNNVILADANGRVIFNIQNYQNDKDLSTLKVGIFFTGSPPKTQQARHRSMPVR